MIYKNHNHIRLHSVNYFAISAVTQEVDHIIPRSGSSQDNIENLQLLCAHCNRVKGDRPQEYLVARLRELGKAA